MSIPKYDQMYRSFLKSLEDGKVHPYIDAKRQVIKDFKLSEEDVSEMLENGKQTLFNNRIGWCRTYLKKATLIDSPSRAHFILTSAGRKELEAGENITNEILKRYPSFVEFLNGESSCEKDKGDKELSDETPQEILERVQKELDTVLKDEILERIHRNPPDFFEHLVVGLMEKMGYGRGKVTQKTRDEGIDGVVYQDKLGFDVIYIQAKRYDPKKIVGSPEVRQFYGAMPEKNAKGMFITTAQYSKDAKQYAEQRHIILIDGPRLAQLMIEYEYGVSTQCVYKIKKIDTDFYEEVDQDIV